MRFLVQVEIGSVNVRVETAPPGGARASQTSVPACQVGFFDLTQYGPYAGATISAVSVQPFDQAAQSVSLFDVSIHDLILTRANDPTGC